MGRDEMNWQVYVRKPYTSDRSLMAIAVTFRKKEQFQVNKAKSQRSPQPQCLLVNWFAATLL